MLSSNSSRKVIVSIFIATLILPASIHAQNLIRNGSFESYGGTGYNSNIGAGLTDWNIGTMGGIDIALESDWQAADGTTSITLNWGGPESVSQGIVTSAGQLYRLSFYMAAEIYGGEQFRTLDVIWNSNVVGTSTFEYTGQGPTNMGWTKVNYTVLGTGSDILAFQSTTEGNYGPAIDNIQLVAVPEPATIAGVCFGIAMLRRTRSRGN